MSAYAEWKHGQITDAEYAGACRKEAWEADHPEPDEEEEVFEEDDIEEF